MPNYAESRRDLESYIAARVPLIGVRTIEQMRALRLVKQVATAPKRANLPFWIYTRATGVRDLRTNGAAYEDRSLAGAMDFAASQFTSRAQATMVFVDPEDLSDDNTASRHVAELARLAESNSGSIILITDTPLWSGLQRLGMSVGLDLPDSNEMYEVITEFLRDHHGVVPIAWSDSDARRAAEFLVGVPEGTAINVLATMVTKGSVEREDVEILAEFKDKHFGDLAGLERIRLREADYAVGGLTSLRSWLHRKHKIMVADLRNTQLRPPRGVLLVGVPGCGKSLSAKTIAAEWRLPLYRLDLAATLGQYVGQSEGRLREALETADRVAPCVLWIDEIEKGLAGQSDSTGIGRRLVGQFLFWLQESRARVFVVATANDVQALPPELLRKGRFDELFFVDLPDADDRREIIELYYRRYVRQDQPAVPELLDKLVSLSEGFAGSDIESALHDVGAEALIKGGADQISAEFIVETFANTFPLSRTNPEQIDEIRSWGRERAVPAGRVVATPMAGTAHAGRRMVLLGD
ncbi:AAA family ATPase [Solwaraspora sp. WMMD406]|uniref:AAA family ATPase n=1 Tax=Solwaraspora sp. WMMD406 TaxID=3016095 RepID=UPI002417C940|nr:AAA family ATPase [Solwaraspora sp. WMMD406]MDG4762715.1 AAA family ATPase [Solwaraspora sp. WMMD406]